MANYWPTDERYKVPTQTWRANLYPEAARNYGSTHREAIPTHVKKELDIDGELSQSVFNLFKERDENSTFDPLNHSKPQHLQPRPQPQPAPARIPSTSSAPRVRSTPQQAYDRLDAKKRRINEDKRQILEEQRRIRIRAGRRRDQLKAANEIVRKAEAEKQIALAKARRYTGIRAIRPDR